jgi:hypothetical protein
MDGDTSALIVASHGVTVEITVDDPSVLGGVESVLPPGWETGDPSRVAARLVLTRAGEVLVDDETVRTAVDAPAAVQALDAALRSVIAQNAPEHVFVHAGVVAREGRAIVLPGATWSGKTTLVAALVRAGATYFSDEFAVLDSEGFVHPYPKPLSLRSPGKWAQTDVAAEEIGAVGSEPAEVSVIASTRYRRSDAALRAGTAAGGALALLSHAIAARARSAAVLEAARAAATNSLYLEGPRGEAEPTARWLISLVDSSEAPPRDARRQSPGGLDARKFGEFR